MGCALVSGPKWLAKLDLGLVVEDVGFPEDQGLVLVQGRPDLGDGGVAEVAAEVQAADLGADAGAELGEFELGFGDGGHCLFLTGCGAWLRRG